MAVVTVPEETNNGPKRLLLAVGVVGLLVAGVFAALAIGGSSSTSAGADTPEDAYQQLFDALANEDLIGAAEILLPAERETLVQPGFNIVDQLKRLEVLDPALDLANIAGVDLEYANVEFATTQLTEDIVGVRILGGTVSSSVDPQALPLGRLILDRLPEGTIPVEIDSSLEAIDPTEDGLVAVRRDGKWYASLWYSVAEAARLDAGLPLPDPADAIRPRGGSSAELAVEEMIRSAIDLDVRRIIELLPPGEADALHDYAPLFLPDAESAARDARRALRDLNIEIDLVSLDLSSVDRGEDKVVLFHGGELLVTSDIADVSIEVSNGSLTAKASIPDADVRIELTVIGDCFEVEIRDFDGEILELERECAGDVDRLIEDMLGGEILVGDLPDFDIFSQRPVLGVFTVERDGQWFVSPLGTMIELQVDVLAAIDVVKLEALIDWFIAQSEGDAAGALIGA
jgi:hypothetical protein